MLCWSWKNIMRKLAYRNISWMVRMLVHWFIKTINVICRLIPFKVYHELRACSLIVINFQALSNKLFVRLTHVNIRLKQLINTSICYLFEKNVIVLIFPWTMTINQLKGYHTNCPYVTFIRITIKLQWLWWHIKRRSYVVIKLFLAPISINSKTEICQDYSSLSDEYICDF